MPLKRSQYIYIIVEFSIDFFRYIYTTYALISSNNFTLRVRENSRKIPNYYQTVPLSLDLRLLLCLVLCLSFSLSSPPPFLPLSLHLPLPLLFTLSIVCSQHL